MILRQLVDLGIDLTQIFRFQVLLILLYFEGHCNTFELWKENMWKAIFSKDWIVHKQQFFECVEALSVWDLTFACRGPLFRALFVKASQLVVRPLNPQFQMHQKILGFDAQVSCRNDGNTEPVGFYLLSSSFPISCLTFTTYFDMSMVWQVGKLKHLRRSFGKQIL